MGQAGDAILGSMKRSERIGFAVPRGRQVMTLTYGTIAGQVGDLRWCARQVQRNALGSSGFSVINWFGPPPMDFPPHRTG